MKHLQIKLALTFAFFVFFAVSVYGSPKDSPRSIILLDGPGWKLVGLEPGQGEKIGINKESLQLKELIPTSIPNNVQLAIGLIDPYSQDKELVEINRKEWWYIRSFASPKIGQQQQVRLIFDGVDYFADVWLNGEKLGNHEGAFTGFSFDITKQLQAKSDNYLAVRVTSPWKVEGRSHYEFMKGEYEENWDGMPGPGQVTFPLGLHRSVRLEVVALTRIETLQVSTATIGNDRADLKIRVSVVNSGLAQKYKLKLSLQPENFTGSSLDLPDQQLSFSGNPDDAQVINLSASVEHPKLWWTWDMGAQNLYRAQATIYDSKGVAIDRFSAVFGIRTLERDSNILYRLNGKPVFMRGAWYPLSRLFPAEPDRWTYEKDLLQARHANMNHLVNFTVMEKKEFYELADRMGMLIFVELPFNQLGPLDALNAQNPRKDEYIKWCSGEVSRIVSTWANHPSIALWCPVAEVTTNGQDFTTSWDFRLREAAEGYGEFLRKIEEIVKANDPDALYFRSFCDFGERHFWHGGLGGIYDNHFESKKEFISEYGGMAFFPYETILKIVDPHQIWNDKQKPWSSLNLPVDLGELSYLTGFSYGGLAMEAEYIYKHADQHPRSLKEFTDATQIYQDFIYGYAADAYRRKLSDPVNGIRSWSFKDFAEKPLCSFGVIDCNNTALPSYYTQKRTFEPVTMSYAVRYALESFQAGAALKVPVWISNATPESITGTIESGLFNLKGERLQHFQKEVSVSPAGAKAAYELDWKLPEEAGIYLLRGKFTMGQQTLARAEMYLKVVPPVTRKAQRILVIGTTEWAPPVRDYLGNFGVEVTSIIYEPTVVRTPDVSFPESVEQLRSQYDAVWLTGFNNFWREAPESWSSTIEKAVDAGTTFIHTGSWASFHGGGDDQTSALDLTYLANILPVEIEAKNDVFTTNNLGWIDGGTLSADPWLTPQPKDKVLATSAAPDWLKAVQFPDLSLSHHVLKPRPDARVLLNLNDNPLLVTGRYGQGTVIAYPGFSPSSGNDSVMLDRVLQTSAEHLLFADVCAAILVLASKEDPSLPIADLLKTRSTPLFESLKNESKPEWPQVSLSWQKTTDKIPRALVHIQNGSSYLRRLRLRLDGPDFNSGKALPLWSNQYFDLLPNETVECTVEIRMAEKRPLGKAEIVAELLQGSVLKRYELPPLQ